MKNKPLYHRTIIIITSVLLLTITFVNSCTRHSIRIPVTNEMKRTERVNPGKKQIIDSILPGFKKQLNPPLNFLIIGDSMIGGYFGLRLTQQLNGLPGVTARRMFRKSTGLSQLVRYNWSARSIRYISKYRPDILVVMFGSNDGLAVRLKSGKLIYYRNKKWEGFYRQRVHAYLKLVAPHVKKVYFVGQPSTKHRFFGKRYPALNRIYREECSKVPGAVYMPSWELTSLQGKYLLIMQDRKGKTGYVKSKHDHVHHTPFGGKVLAELFIDYIMKDVVFSFRKGL